MSFSEIISLFAGIALFLFGMSLMGDGLKKLSGNKLEPILYKLSSTTFKGILLGTGVTAVVQSSCATAVMVVGFVNSGMMKVRQGISIILGAILGTSITGWIICLSYIEGAGGFAQILSTATLTGFVAVGGILLQMFSKKKTLLQTGNIMMGFAVLMYGMSSMSGAVSGLGKAPWFTKVITSMSNPMLGILVGIVFTAVLQSASAAVGIVQALSVTGVIAFDAALPLLMGIAIGASVPVLLSAIGANTDGKRTALVYPIATGMGTLFLASLFYIAGSIVTFPFMSRIVNPFSIAFINTILRFLIVAVLLPFTDVIEAMASSLVSGKKQKTDELPEIRLEERFIHHPAMAIEQSKMTMAQMANLSERALSRAVLLISDFGQEGFQIVTDLEQKADDYEDAMGTYLAKLTGQEMTQAQSRETSKFLHTISDFERISDHALNLAENAREISEKKIKFSAQASEELDTIFGAVSEVVHIAVKSFNEQDLALAEQVQPLEEVINDLCDKMKMGHVERLQRGECTISQGFVFNDILTNCERISDHCSNIAIAMLALDNNTFDTHGYLVNLREKNSPEFQSCYERYKQQYSL